MGTGSEVVAGGHRRPCCGWAPVVGGHGKELCQWLLRVGTGDLLWVGTARDLCTSQLYRFVVGGHGSEGCCCGWAREGLLRVGTCCGWARERGTWPFSTSDPVAGGHRRSCCGWAQEWTWSLGDASRAHPQQLKSKSVGGSAPKPPVPFGHTPPPPFPPPLPPSPSPPAGGG